MFKIRRRVAFHETDAMGVVHHTNHVKYFEEARVEWLRKNALTEVHVPIGKFTFAVVDLKVQYMAGARFDDELEVLCQGRMEGVRIQFRYAIWCERLKTWTAVGTTDLVPLDENLGVVRLPKEVRDAFNREAWTDQEVGPKFWPPATR
jgi:acyl-CoA thioester hydrolase